MYLRTIKEVKTFIESNTFRQSDVCMMFVGEASYDCISEIVDFCNQKTIKIFGGVFAKLLVGSKARSDGFIVNVFNAACCSRVLPLTFRINANLQPDKQYTAFVLADGLSEYLKNLTDTVYNRFGDSVKYIGGGAGFYNLDRKPCIFDNSGVYKDAAYVCVVENEMLMAVEHGWKKLQGPLNVTSANGNELMEINYYNAFEVYRDIIRDESDITISKEGFFTYAKDYPFGIIQEGSNEIIIRDPIKLNEMDSIICVANIPNKCELYIMGGNADSLLRSSEKLAEYCAKNVTKDDKIFVFDCISRAMFLDDKFQTEIANIQSKLPIFLEGALSISEFASGQKGELLIHNKSTIIGVLK